MAGQLEVCVGFRAPFDSRTCRHMLADKGTWRASREDREDAQSALSSAAEIRKKDFVLCAGLFSSGYASSS